MALEALGKTPISQEAPAGQDVRYEPDFEALSGEIAKLGSPTAGSAVNWDVVVDLSTRILETQSKHLQVAAYLNYGLIRKNQWEGLSQGVRILKDLLENFWPALFPPKKRMKGRIGIINWWAEKIGDFIDSAEMVTWEKDKRDSLIDDLDFIDQFFSENIEDGPFLLPMVKKIKGMVTEQAPAEPAAPEPESQPAQTSEQPAQPEPDTPPVQTPVPDSQPSRSAPAATPAPAPAAAVPENTPADAAGMLSQALDFLGKTAGSLRNENVYNPLSYKLNRISAWSDIGDLPPASGGKTMIEAPDSQVTAIIEGLYSAGNWTDLADTCEDKVPQFLFWLDLSRYVAQSMENLGHQDVAQVIADETKNYVLKLKGIENLNFADGTPFANPETRQWLNSISSPAPGDARQPAGDNADNTDAEVEKALGKARELTRDNKLDQALGLFAQGLSGTGSMRATFLWKTGLLRILVESRQTIVAAPYAEDILGTIDRHRLDLWEPQMAVQAMSLALTALRLEENDDNDDRVQGLIKKIAMLDPIKALNI